MPRTVVFVHAHPDDEALLTSGTMAALAAHGHRVVLVVATAGEAGLAADGLRADLGERRLTELHASADALGVSRVELLGYADSGLAADPTPPPPPGRRPRLADAPVTEVAGRVADLLREERADVVVGYDAQGGYGHPDHVAVHHVAAAAQAMAGTPLLLEATVPRARLLAAARQVNRLLPRSRQVDLTPWTRAYSAAADVTHCIDVRRYARSRRASMRAHASQATADSGARTLGVFTRIPPPLFGAVFGREWYRQPGLTVPRRHRSLFATLPPRELG
ncbi:PIG-L deacetylase family protein [Nakamurella sp.]|uniref:PIG-L deacetylase family protein n=1 Tax=Nakamurella sp. TaxID=1869182 RepID=UPI003B3AB136